MSSFLTYKVVIRMFMEFGLVNQFQIPYKVSSFVFLNFKQKFNITLDYICKQTNAISFYFQVLCRWILSVRKNYRPVKYHNWRHALNVCQTMYTVLRTGKMDRFMDDLEVNFQTIIAFWMNLIIGSRFLFKTYTEYITFI